MFNPKNILDIGCSDGLLLEFFFEVDISKKALSYANFIRHEKRKLDQLRIISST